MRVRQVKRMRVPVGTCQKHIENSRKRPEFIRGCSFSCRNHSSASAYVIPAQVLSPADAGIPTAVPAGTDYLPVYPHNRAHIYSKCKWHTSKLDFLAFTLGADSIKMDKKKLSTILDWPEPKSVKEVQSFLGFANFYRRFIHHFALLTTPLHALTQKSDPPTPFAFPESARVGLCAGGHPHPRVTTRQVFERQRPASVSAYVRYLPDVYTRGCGYPPIKITQKHTF